jgi:GWxTD domain-containing protein
MMKFRPQVIFVLWMFCAILIIGWAFPGQTPSSPQRKSQKEKSISWLDTEVQYLLTEEERQVFSKLTTEEERDHFIEEFWRRRDPDPSTPVNEFKEEFYRRIAYANEQFTAGLPGWRTDRGRIYIVHGPPNRRDAHPTGGRYQKPPWQGGDTITTFPFEIWEYDYIPGIGNDITIEFVDRSSGGLYELETDPNRKDVYYWRRGEMPQQRMWERAKDSPFERLAVWSKMLGPPPIQYQTLKQVVASQVHYSALPFAVRTDFVKVADQSYLVPVTIEIKNKNLVYSGKEGVYEAEAHLYAQFLSITGRTVYEFDDALTSTSQGQGQTLADLLGGRTLYQRLVPLPSGRFRVNIVVKDVNGDKIGTAEQLVVLPGESEVAALSVSSLVLADVIQPTPEGVKPGDPFVLGKLKVIPNLDKRFSSRHQLGLYLEAYGLQPRGMSAGQQVSGSRGQQVSRSASQQPSVSGQRSSVIGQQSSVIGQESSVVSQEQSPRHVAETDAVFEVTILSADGRSIAASPGRETRIPDGTSIAWSKAVPLADLSKGKYRVQVKVTDRAAGKSVTREDAFEIYE